MLYFIRVYESDSETTSAMCIDVYLLTRDRDEKVTRTVGEIVS